MSSKYSWFVFMLAVICLSLAADAQSTVDETRSCDDGSDTLEELVSMVTAVASNQQQNAREIRDVKSLLLSESVGTNETSLEDVVKEAKAKITNEIKEVKKTIASGCERANDTRGGGGGC